MPLSFWSFTVLSHEPCFRQCPMRSKAWYFTQSTKKYIQHSVFICSVRRFFCDNSSYGRRRTSVLCWGAIGNFSTSLSYGQVCKEAFQQQAQGYLFVLYFLSIGRTMRWITPQCINFLKVLFFSPNQFWMESL